MPEYTPKQIVPGDDLQLFVSDNNTYRSLAYATSHQLSISADVADTNSKDHGQWKGNEVNKLGWEITSDNLMAAEEHAFLFDAMVAKTPIEVVFCPKAEAANVIVADGDADHYTPTTTAGKHQYRGTAYITSLNANAPSGEKATYSVTLTGTGALSHVVVEEQPGE
jgi:TP901-1 family phage major tail protein